MCGGCRKLNHFKIVCKNADARGGAIHEAEQMSAPDKQIDMVTINSFKFSSIYLILVAIEN